MGVPAQRASGSMTAVSYTPDLDALLTRGARFAGDGAEYVIDAHEAGTVTLPTGRVVACDPLTGAGDALPFAVAVPPGKYPLRAWVAAILEDGEQTDARTVALQLVVDEAPAVRWEPALDEGQEPVELESDGFFGYPVDAGVGTLADVVATQALDGWDFDRLEEVYIPAEVEAAPAAIDAVTDEATGANVIVVTSGWGDGAYPTFVGYAADGRVTSFVTDFLVLVPEDADLPDAEADEAD